jgi:hypothetical protein
MHRAIGGQQDLNQIARHKGQSEPGYGGIRALQHFLKLIHAHALHGYDLGYHGRIGGLNQRRQGQADAQRPEQDPASYVLVGTHDGSPSSMIRASTTPIVVIRRLSKV